MNWPVARDAALAAAAATALAFSVNAARPGGLPLIRKEPYALVVPCPVISGEVTALAPGDPRIRERGTLLLDARSPTDFARWRLDGARNLAYDYLEPVSDSEVKEIAASGAARVVVYGDGEDPDSGRELAKELSGRGIRNVFVVEGGAAALQGAMR